MQRSPALECIDFLLAETSTENEREYLRKMRSAVTFMLMIAGLALIVYDRIRSGKKIGILFLGGASRVALGVLLHLIVWLTAVPFLPGIALSVFRIAGIVLLILSYVKPDMDADLRLSGNIRKNRNKSQAIPDAPVILFGLFLLLYGAAEMLSVICIFGVAVIAYGIYRLVRSLTKPDIWEDILYEAKDEELSSEIKETQESKIKKYVADNIVQQALSDV